MLSNNKANLLISIVAAIVFWAWITMAINPPVDQQIRGVTVDLVNLESLYDRGLTVDRTQTFVVDVVVNGARTEVTDLTAADIRATADMTGYPKGYVDVKVNVTVPSNVTAVQVKPETIRVEIVDRITVTKPVELDFTETFPADMEPGFITVMPNEMEVAGTVDAVDSVDYIRVTVPEGVLTEDPKTLTLEAVPITKDGAPDYFVSLSQDTVQATAMLCAVKQVPLLIEEVGEPPETIDITELLIPRRITIRGTKEAVAGVTQVRAKELNLAALTETEEIPVEPYLPEGVEVADRSKDLSVTVEVQGVAKKEFTYKADQIEVAGLAEGLYGHVNTGSIKLTLLAPESDIAGIGQSDIRVYVEVAEDQGAGEAIEMAVRVECDKPYKSIQVTPEKVRVTINDQEGYGSQGATPAQDAAAAGTEKGGGA